MRLLELKRHIPKLLILLLLVLLSFSIYSSLNKIEDKRKLNSVDDFMDGVIISSKLIHSLQLERGYSSGYTASNGRMFSDELTKQIELTDRYILAVEALTDNFDASQYSFDLVSEINLYRLFLNSIEKKREYIHNLKLNPIEILDFYSKCINAAIKISSNVNIIGHEAGLLHLTQSYMTISNLKEKAGIERALLNKVYGEKRLSSDDFYKFGELVSAQKIYMQNFQRRSNREYDKFLKPHLESVSFKNVEINRETIFLKNKKNRILSEINRVIGYGGLIHNFKNYVIRGKKRYENDTDKNVHELYELIYKYKSLPNIKAKEISKLEVIRDVFVEYHDGLPKITESYKHGGKIKALDRVVKVDDTPAIEAIADLTSNIYGSQEDWFKHSTQRINLLRDVEIALSLEIKRFIEIKNRDLNIELIIRIILLVIIIVVLVSSYSMIVELLESGKMLNRAQKNTHSGSYEIFLEDNIIIWSDEHYKILGVDKETFEPSNEHFMEFVHVDDKDIVKDGIKRAMSLHKISYFDYRVVLKDKSEIYVHSSAEVKKYSAQGKPLILVGTITDITYLKNLEQEIVDTQKDVIFTMGAIGESRSKETGNHVKRVAEYSKLLYLLSGASNEDAELLKMASPMHDIGKVGIPDDILHKKGSLNKEEWSVMQTHSEMGYEMLKNSDRKILKLASTVALTHHEKYNGSGYPRGLIGDEIPFVGRITALADVFDALGSDRCYKKAWELDDIFSLIKEESAQHFDPELVDLFFTNIDKFLEIRDRYKDIQG